MHIRAHLPSANLTNRRVFLRADLNVPLDNGSIASDFRLKALKPTLDLLIEKNACIILATHMGRPHGVDVSLSTKILIFWFENQGYTILWASSLEEAENRSLALAPKTILLLENMRFFEGEQSTDAAKRQKFAHQLRALADYYVNDAFALLHRQDTSITLLPELYDKKDKTIGFLIEREINTLSKLFEDPQRPFMLIIGGGKVKDKLPFIEKLLDKVNIMVILPALVFTFLKALGKDVGKSLVDDEFLEPARQILLKAKEKSVRIIFPLDFMVLTDSLAGDIKIVKDIPANALGIAVGPETLELYKKEIAKVKTVFVNGAMGISQRPETLEPLYELLQSIAHLGTCSIIGGGDSVSAVYHSHLENKITYCSTGGGASLYFLTCGTLPALEYI